MTTATPKPRTDIVAAINAELKAGDVRNREELQALLFALLRARQKAKAKAVAK